MSSPTSQIHQRLTTLERELRRWRSASAVAMLGLLAVIVAVGVLRTGNTLEAQSFVLRDAQGRRRGEFLMEDNGSPSLGLYDVTGARRVRLALDVAGLPRLSMTGPTKTHIWLAIGGLGVPEMILHDQKGAQRAELTLDRTGAPALVLSDAAETTRALFGVDQEAAPALLLHGKDDARANLAILADGSPLLGLQDDEGNIQFRAP